MHVIEYRSLLSLKSSLGLEQGLGLFSLIRRIRIKEVFGIRYIAEKRRVTVSLTRYRILTLFFGEIIATGGK